ncbi:MAG: adenosylcobinamide-GDP ribazoletransferase [Acidimicrobiales bacterium]
MTLPAGLVGALQFLTRVPIRVSRPVPHDQVVPWFPVVGALIGLVVGGVAALAAPVFGAPLGATLGVVAGLLVTGAFHEDGLADMADAFGGGWTPERRLEILKDSRHGTYAVAALTSSILVRVAALAAFDAPSTMLAAAVVAHTLARGAAVVAMAVLPLAVDSGLGAGAAKAVRPVGLAAGTVAGLGVAALAVGWWAVPSALVAGGAMAIVGALAIRKIGGIAGDVLGAVEQVAECAVLVVIAGLAGRSALWWS